MKNDIRLWVAVGALLMLVSIGQARAPAPRPLSLLVIPEQVTMVQMGFDLVARRPLALATYRLSSRTGELVLHGWTGQEWTRIDLSEYETGDFLLRQPDRIILVEGLDDLPMELVLASGWGPRVMSVSAVDPAEFLNAMGQLFDFSPSEWRWFASRYRLGMEQVGGQEARISWYDQMSAARRQPPRRQEEPAPVPVAPLPVPVVEPGPEPEPEPERMTPKEVPPPDRAAEETPRAVVPTRPPVATRPQHSPVAPLPAASEIIGAGEVDDHQVDDMRTIK